MAFDLLKRRKDKFVLWAPGRSFGETPPQLILGIYNASAAGSFTQIFGGPLTDSGLQDLWELDPNIITPPLKEGTYHYWFGLDDSTPEKRGHMLITDPIAYTVDYRVAKQPNDQPATVIKYRGGKLWPCDIDGTEVVAPKTPELEDVADNNRIVIYELPVSWAKPKDIGSVETDKGTFADVLALFDVNEAGNRFKDIPAIAHEAMLSDLGINALELLPTADAKPTDGWGMSCSVFPSKY
jgi:pullulanase